MSKTADKALAESMGRRRPREVIQAEVAESVLAEMVQVTTVDLPIASLFRSRFQFRQMGSEDDINRLAESMQASGLISPIVVRPLLNPDSEQRISPIPDFLVEGKSLTVKYFEVITGHHRVQAALKLGWGMIPAVIKHMTDAQAAIALTSDNAIKKDLTDWDRYQSILMLKSTGACKTGREIAAALGISASQVTNLQAFGSLPEPALAIVQAHPAVCAYKLAYKLQNSGLNEGEPALVTEALQHLADRLMKQEQIKDRLQKDELTAQEQVIPWIAGRVAARNAIKSYRREIRIQRPIGKDIRVIVTDGGATIKADGLHAERLAKLIEDNLVMLTEGMN